MSIRMYFDINSRATDLRALLDSYTVELIQKAEDGHKLRIAEVPLYMVPTSQLYASRPAIETDERGLYLGKEDPPAAAPHESTCGFIDTRRTFTAAEYAAKATGTLWSGAIFINLHHVFRHPHLDEQNSSSFGRHPFEVEDGLKLTIAYESPLDGGGSRRIWYWSFRFEPGFEYLSLSR